MTEDRSDRPEFDRRGALRIGALAGLSMTAIVLSTQDGDHRTPLTGGETSCAIDCQESVQQSETG